jgi:hypothetical protein
LIPKNHWNFVSDRKKGIHITDVSNCVEWHI